MTLALIAGRGMLPVEVARAQDVSPLICGYEGFSPDELVVELRFRLETLGTLLEVLTERGITQVCFCGGIDRPQLDPSKLDTATMALVPLFQKALAVGDNGALSVVKDIFESKGFEVLGADQLLPALVMQARILSVKEPDAQMRNDAARGEAVLKGLAVLDIGQACVIGAEQVLAVETFGGTDHMLTTLPETAHDMRPVLCKGPKSKQIREIDLPTIGPDTIEAAHQAGVTGVIVDAGDVIVLKADVCAGLADQYGMVLWCRASGEPA